jgi:multiple sugar transport system permease protein
MTQGAVAADALPARRRRRKRFAPKRIAGRILLDAVVVVLAAFFIAPIVWGFLNSLRGLHEGVTGPVIPNPAHWSNYHYAWSGIFSFSHYLWNTVVLTLLATVPAVLTSALAGYAFARMRAWGRNTALMFVLATTFVPFSIVFIPFFWVVVKLDIYSTRWPWLIWGIAGNAFLIFLFRQFYSTFPAELDDAAAIDGAGHLRAFLQIYLPNSVGPLAVAFVILGTGWWGEYIYASLLLPDRMTPLGVKVATGYYDPTVQNLLMPAVLAGSLMFTLPAVLAFFLLQKRLARGIVTTGLKG